MSVEEQFYLVYPTFFYILARLRMLSLRARLSIGLSGIIAGSLLFSVVETSGNPTAAYFSPLTRAWELALGGLVAVGAPWLMRLPARVTALTTWVGLGAILSSAFAFTTATAYPGIAVGVPVLGAAMIIAAGTRPSRWSAERILGLAPFRGVGKLSYSLYLWHWPILMLAAERAGKVSLTFAQNLPWLLVALMSSVATFVLVENPVRHARVLHRVRWSSVVVGAALIVVTIATIGVQTEVGSPRGNSAASTTGSSGKTSVAATASLAAVQRLVAASANIEELPADLTPPFAQAVTEDKALIGLPDESTGCWPAWKAHSVPRCVFGDPAGAKTMVLFGDSYAGMWFGALDDIATRAHWRLVVITKGACPAAALSTSAPGTTSGDWAACDDWHRFAVERVNHIDPGLLIVSQFPARTPAGTLYDPGVWQRGLTLVLNRMHAGKKVVIGNVPLTGGTSCLARHATSVQTCAVPASSVRTPYSESEVRAAKMSGSRYVDITSWFCAARCSAVIGRFDVYVANHVTAAYSRYLEGVLAASLKIGT